MSSQPPADQQGDYESILNDDHEAALYRAILHCRTHAECRAFLADLCTPQELAALAERWVLARLLDKGGLSYRDISAATGASTTTIGRVARFLQQEPHHGYRLVLERLKDEADAKQQSTSGENSLP